jgi:hypothetical protein
MRRQPGQGVPDGTGLFPSPQHGGRPSHLKTKRRVFFVGHTIPQLPIKSARIGL